jgi:hypothetical protein
MAPNLNRINTQLHAAAGLLASHGTVVATWRKRGNSLTGPYYRVRYFENGIRRSIYLGRDEGTVPIFVATKMGLSLSARPKKSSTSTVAT